MNRFSEADGGGGKRLDKKHVLGLAPLRFAEGLIGSLRAAYDHPNRKLHFDDLFIGLLLAFYNPVVRSLRGVEDASQMPGINRRLSVEAIRRSTASDALAVFDADLLHPLIGALRRCVSPRQMDEADDTLRGLVNRLIAYDGSYFRTSSDVAWALRQRHKTRVRARVRLDVHLCVRDGVPAGVAIAGAGDPGEPTALLDGVEAGQVVVADRGCFSHATVHALRDRGVDFVLRLQSGVRCDVIGERALTDADRAAGVLSDQTVLLRGSKNTHGLIPGAPGIPGALRLVTIQPTGDSTRDATMCDAPIGATRDAPRQAMGDASCDASAHDALAGAGALPGAAAAAPSPLRLLTSVDDEATAAWMIGHVYRRRWDVELFFRWLKCVAGWEHLLSESANGMRVQFYVALIGTLLLAAATGRPPDRYGFNLMSMAAAGLGTVDDALVIYQRRCAERDRDRQRRLQRRAENKTP